MFIKSSLLAIGELQGDIDIIIVFCQTILFTSLVRNAMKETDLSFFTNQHMVNFRSLTFFFTGVGITTNENVHEHKRIDSPFISQIRNYCI